MFQCCDPQHLVVCKLFARLITSYTLVILSFLTLSPNTKSSAMANPLAVAPTPPDFCFCSDFFNDPNNYETYLVLNDCVQAEALMPRGSQPLPVYEPNYHQLHFIGQPPPELPLLYHHGESDKYCWLLKLLNAKALNRRMPDQG